MPAIFNLKKTLSNPRGRKRVFRGTTSIRRLIRRTRFCYNGHNPCRSTLN